MLKTIVSLVIISLLGNAPSGAIIPETPQTAQVWQSSELLSVAQYPKKNAENIPPVLEARSALALDFHSGEILFENNPDEKLPMASITKLMTAVIIAEEEDISEIATISQNAAVTQGSKIWLYPGETLRVKDLLAALLIPSANDAGVALAEFSAGSEKDFVKKMNEKAKKLGLTNTNFSNTVGFDTADHYSTARDLSLLAMYAYKNSVIRSFAGQTEMTITSTDGATTHKLSATNQILGGELNIVGLKTGNTLSAGPSLVAVAKGPLNHEVISVVLNSPQRFSETKLLLDWVYRTYTW